MKKILPHLERKKVTPLLESDSLVNKGYVNLPETLGRSQKIEKCQVWVI